MSRSLTKDLKDIDIPTPIKELANDLYIKFLDSSTKKLYRQRTRDAIKFAFIFKAYYTLKIAVSPDEIIRRLGISGSHSSIIKRGTNLAFSDQDGKDDDEYFGVVEITPGMLRILELPSSWENDIYTLNATLEYYYSHITEGIKPQYISVSIIIFYAMNIKDVDVNPHEYCSITYTPYAVACKVYKYLGNISENILE